jgi:hypothetical protein
MALDGSDGNWVTPSCAGLTRLRGRSRFGAAKARASTLFFAADKDVDGRVICAKTRFALLPGHDDDETSVPISKVRHMR